MSAHSDPVPSDRAAARASGIASGVASDVRHVASGVGDVASGVASDLRRLARSFPAKPVSFVRAAGHELFTADGQSYTDLGGASHGVANFGHNHPRIVAAIREQAGQLIYATSTLPSAVRGGFLDTLHRILPPHLERTFLCNSGTEAVEAALKHAAAKTGRKRFVAVRGSFHGRTLGALGATHRLQYRQPFEGLMPQVDFVPPNDVAALEAAVTDHVAAVLVEPVQGEGGLTVLDDAFLRTAQSVAHAHGALLVADEVQTGLGRTGRDLALDGTGVRADIVTLGKSLAGGLPAGAACMTEEVAAAMPPGGHGTTFGGLPIVCAAGMAALSVLREERLAARAATEGERFRSALASIASPLVREVRGRGLMLGVDLRVKSQPTLDALLAQHLLALGAGPTVVRFLPPLTIPREALESAAHALDAALAAQAPKEVSA